MSERADDILDMFSAARGSQKNFESKVKKLAEQGM